MIPRHSTPTNVNLETGIAYGMIAANSLHPDIFNDLQMEGTDVYYADALAEEQRRLSTEEDVQREMCHDEGLVFDDQGEDELQERTLQHVKDNWEGSGWEQQFNDGYNPDEPVHEGLKDGVRYRTTWLGGAPMVWVFFSPHVGRFRQCSPCVPGAGDLDSPDPDGIEAYDVPPEWRDTGSER